MSEQNNPWQQAAKSSSKKASNKKTSNRKNNRKKNAKPAGKSGSYKGAKTHKPGKPGRIVPAPKLKEGQQSSQQKAHKPNGPVLINGKIVDPRKQAKEQEAYAFAPLSNPADETIPIKSKPNISGGLIPTAAPNFRSGFISIVGRPNVGKSTLMNYLVGQKIAITSPVAQTTRNRLQGILTTPQAQIIFVDTPGIHKPHHELGKVLVQNARVAVNSVDVVLFVVEATSPAGRGDLFVANLVAQTKSPVVLGLNKLDQLPEGGRKAAEIKNSYEAIAAEHGWDIVRFSALTGDGVEQLQDT